MTEQQPLTDGRILWLQEECHDLVKIYREAQATRQHARAQILRTLYFEMSMDKLDPAAHREQVEMILDKELDHVYNQNTQATSLPPRVLD